MAVTKLTMSGFKPSTFNKYDDFLAGNAAYIPDSAYVAVGHSTTPYISVYSWSNSTGFGSKFSNPATLPTAAVYGVAFSPDNSYLAVAIDASPWVSVYPWSSSGFGTKFSNPATLPTATGISAAWDSTGSTVFFGAQATPYIFAYPFSGSGFGTKYSNPASLPSSTTFSLAYSAANNTVGVATGYASSTVTAVYPWNNSTGFGTKYSDPGGWAVAGGRGMAWSPNGNYLAYSVANSAAPSYFERAFPWSSGFGTAYSHPATAPGGEGGVTFNPASTAVVFATNGSAGNVLDAYAFSASGYGTKYANPSVAPTNGVSYTGQQISFSKSGGAFVITQNASPYVEAYSWNNSTGFGTKYSSPSTLPTGASQSVVFSN